MSLVRLKKPLFDISLLRDALKKTPSQRFKEACDLYDFYERVTPFPFTRVAKSFKSFKDYEKWQKKQKDPRYW